MKGTPRSGGRGLNIKTVTLLRYLARDSKSDKIKLRACELLLMLEGRLAQPEQKKPAKATETPELAILVDTQTTELKDFCNQSDLHANTLELLESELVLSAAR